MRIARLATIGLVSFSVFSTGCIGCIDDEEGNSATNVAENNTTPTAECQPDDFSGVLENGSISEDIVFCGNVEVQANITNSASVEIRIRPGTVFEFGVDKYAEFGWAGNEATVIAEGTADNPIIFRGTTPEPGHWQGLFLSQPTTSASVLKHIVIQHAGGSDEASLTIRTDKDIDVSDVTIEDSEGPGVYAENFGEGSANLTVRNGGDVAAVLTGTGAVTNFPIGGTFENLQTNAIAIDNGSLSGDVTFKNPGIPYLVRANITNNGDSVFNFEAGVELQFESDRYMEFGWAGNEATVNINGTETEPVRFVGSTPDPGHWQGIYVSGPTTSASVLQNFEVEHAGADEAGLDLRTNVTVINATFRNNSMGGFRVGIDGLEADSANINVENSDGPSGYIHANAFTTIPSDGSFGDGTAYVLVDQGSMGTSGTIPALNVPYRIGANLTNNASIDITIESGAEFVFEGDRYWEFGWAGNEITFNIDGAIFRGTDPSPGHWDGLYISNPSTSGSTITNSTVQDAGSAGEEAVDLRTPINFTNNSISNSAGACLKISNGDTNDYSSNTFDCAEGDFR